MGSENSLEDVISSKENLVEHFYNDTDPPHVKANPSLSPVPIEQTNWIEEHRAWRETAILFDQSHHMPELFVSGPDTVKLLKDIGVNSYEKVFTDRGKQFVAVNHEGYIIGESLIYPETAEKMELVSGGPVLNWVEYNAITGKYDVELKRDHNTARNPNKRRIKFRYQIDGPAAQDIFSEVIDGPAPDMKFFHIAQVTIDGVPVTVLRHAMSGHKGVELSGDYAEGERVRDAIMKVGGKYGIREGGTLAYFSTAGEGGWMGSPFPAIFTSPKLKAYREWLPSNAWEAGAQLGGSFVSDNIEDYYVTPWHLGLEKRIVFDHDFIGREALEQMSKEPQRTRRTLVWDEKDVLKIHQSMFEDDLPYKNIRYPRSTYAYQQYDEVRTKDGKLVGLSTYCGYSTNEKKFLSLVMVDREYADDGTELVLTWGEPNGGSRKKHVERHRQTDVRVTVAPAPYAGTVRAGGRSTTV